MGDNDWRASKGLAPPGYKWARIPALDGEFIEGLVRDQEMLSKALSEWDLRPVWRCSWVTGRWMYTASARWMVQCAWSGLS